MRGAGLSRSWRAAVLRAVRRNGGAAGSGFRGEDVVRRDEQLPVADAGRVFVGIELVRSRVLHADESAEVLIENQRALALHGVVDGVAERDRAGLRVGVQERLVDVRREQSRFVLRLDRIFDDERKLFVNRAHDRLRSRGGELFVDRRVLIRNLRIRRGRVIEGLLVAEVGANLDGRRNLSGRTVHEPAMV